MEPIDWKTIKEYEDILFDYCDGIAKITINRPQVYNAFRPQTNCEMLDAMSICRERSDIGVIILTGAGDKAFCSGGDQKVKGIGGYIDENGVPRLNVLDLHKAIRSLPKPVIAMVNGYAIGGSQRAIHQLLHLNIKGAFGYNPFLILSLPYLMALVITQWFDPRNRLARLKRMCHHPIAVNTYLILIIVWWIARNILPFLRGSLPPTI